MSLASMMLMAAVFYASHTQADDEGILRNQRGSADYEAFVDTLGWPVDLLRHRGFSGCLDRSEALLDGRTAVYHCDDAVETVFHVLTHMRTAPASAPEGIDLARRLALVKDDLVHIVWSEYPRDFCPVTIRNTTANVFIIVIYPFQRSANDLYRIQIFARDAPLLNVGPLSDGTIICRGKRAVCQVARRPDVAGTWSLGNEAFWLTPQNSHFCC